MKNERGIAMVKLAILGFGTVGSGVAEVLRENSADIEKNAGTALELRYIVDLREFPDSPFAPLMTRDFTAVERDPEVAVVAEAIGGTGAAYEFTKRCLLAGKSVVTSNKELVAERGLELLNIAREKNVNYLFEASVGGGIPILRPITQCLAGNELDELYGILNGTTNYILTRMLEDGASFGDALREAQKMGCAEADASADIEGYDAVRKICILADLAFGRHVAPEAVSREGISRVTAADLACADKLGYRVKLLGRAYRLDEEHIAAYVAPHLVPETCLLSHVDGLMNGIMVHGNAVGDCMFYGAGAGKRPTASAVVADLIDCARHLEKRRPVGWEAAPEGYVTDASALRMRRYVRTGSPESAVSAAFPEAEVREADGERFFLTEPLADAELAERLSGLEARSVFRILS